MEHQASQSGEHHPHQDRLATEHFSRLLDTVQHCCHIDNTTESRTHITTMHIITRRKLIEYAYKHPNAAASLTAWHTVAKTAKWQSITEVRKTFPHADAAQVASGKTITIFNIAGNNHRLITAIHYNTGNIFILKILTHSQYDKPNWKKEL